MIFLIKNRFCMLGSRNVYSDSLMSSSGYRVAPPINKSFKTSLQRTTVTVASQKSFFLNRLDTLYIEKISVHKISINVIIMISHQDMS
jgi:hypothetical protein